MKWKNLLRRIEILSFVLLLFTGVSFAQNSNAVAEKARTVIANNFGNYNNISVTADNNGRVTITGSVNTLYDKYKIFDLVSKVHGVHFISNQLVVKTPVLPDNVIADNIRDELNYVASIIEPKDIKVKVDNGIAFLSGTVSFYREKLMAKTVASWQKGVRGIDNKIKVLPPKKAVSDQNIKDILTGIIKDNFSNEQGINISVNGGVVTLTGTVHSLWAKNQIEQQFSNVLGVIVVINNLRVVD